MTLRKITEMDRLKSRVAELETVLREEFTGHPHTCDAWGNPPKGDCNCDALVAVEVLSRKPLQSLLLHDAEVLEEAAELAVRYDTDEWGEELLVPVQSLEDRAARLRQQAEATKP